MLIADASYKGRDVLIRIKNRWDSGAILNRALRDGASRVSYYQGDTI